VCGTQLTLTSLAQDIQRIVESIPVEPAALYAFPLDWQFLTVIDALSEEGMWLCFFLRLARVADLGVPGQIREFVSKAIVDLVGGDTKVASSTWLLLPLLTVAQGYGRLHYGHAEEEVPAHGVGTEDDAGAAGRRPQVHRQAVAYARVPPEV
jgi:hypothetical protein